MTNEISGTPGRWMESKWRPFLQHLTSRAIVRVLEEISASRVSNVTDFQINISHLIHPMLYIYIFILWEKHLNT